MKKMIIALVVALFVVSVMSSCKSKDCPAYGQAQTEQTQKV